MSAILDTIKDHIHLQDSENIIELMGRLERLRFILESHSLELSRLEIPSTEIPTVSGFSPGQDRTGEHPIRQPRGPPPLDELISKPTTRFEASKNFAIRTRRTVLHNLKGKKPLFDSTQDWATYWNLKESDTAGISDVYCQRLIHELWVSEKKYLDGLAALVECYQQKREEGNTS